MNKAFGNCGLLSLLFLTLAFSGCVSKSDQNKAKDKSQALYEKNDPKKSGKINWPFSISYDTDCDVRFSDETIQTIVDKVPLAKNRIIRNMFINSPDTVSVWIVPTTTFYSGKERAFFLIKSDSGEWILK